MRACLGTLHACMHTDIHICSDAWRVIAIIPYVIMGEEYCVVYVYTAVVHRSVIGTE